MNRDRCLAMITELRITQVEESRFNLRDAATARERAQRDGECTSDHHIRYHHAMTEYFEANEALILAMVAESKYMMGSP